MVAFCCDICCCGSLPEDDGVDEDENVVEQLETRAGEVHQTEGFDERQQNHRLVDALLALLHLHVHVLYMYIHAANNHGRSRQDSWYKQVSKAMSVGATSHCRRHVCSLHLHGCTDPSVHIINAKIGARRAMTCSDTSTTPREHPRTSDSDLS